MTHLSSSRPTTGSRPRPSPLPVIWRRLVHAGPREGAEVRVRAVAVDEPLGLGAELGQTMTRHVGSYFHEGRATVEDTDKAARCVWVVNAPDTPDPSISFGAERGQIQPQIAGGPVLLAAAIPVGAR